MTSVNGRLAAVSLALLTSVLGLAACGDGDDDNDAGATTAAATTAAGAATTQSATTAAPSGTQPATTTGGSAAGSADATCPSAAEVGAAWGGEVRLDEANAMTGAVGLVFCPYEEVLGPDVTNAFGAPKNPGSFSLTLTDQNPVEAGGPGEEVAGLGEQATWVDGAGELVVWTGERGIIVSMVFPPPSGDAKAVSIALAELVM